MANDDNPIPRRNFLVGAGTAVAASLSSSSAEEDERLAATAVPAPTRKFRRGIGLSSFAMATLPLQCYFARSITRFRRIRERQSATGRNNLAPAPNQPNQR